MKIAKYFVHLTTALMLLGGISLMMESKADIFVIWPTVGFVVASAYIEANEKK